MALHQQLGVLRLGDRRGDQHDLWTGALLAHPFHRLTRLVQPAPDMRQARQALLAIAAHQHRDIGQHADQQRAQVGQPGAGIDHHMLVAHVMVQMGQHSAQQRQCRIDLILEPACPVHVAVQQHRVVIVAVGR